LGNPETPLQTKHITKKRFCGDPEILTPTINLKNKKIKIKQPYWRKNIMAVKIRLRRMGAKKAPFYRVVVADSRYPRNGRFIEEIGYYDPMKEPAVISIDGEKAKDWIAKGAQPTDTVRALLKKTGVQ